MKHTNSKKCGGKCACRKPSTSRPGAVSMIVPGVKLTGEALRFVVRQAAALDVPHAQIVAAAVRIFAEWTEAKEGQRK